MLLGIVSEIYVSQSFVLSGCEFMFCPYNLDFHGNDGLGES